MQSSVRSWRWEYWRWRWPVSILQAQPTEPQNFPVSPRGSEAGTAGPRPQSSRPVRWHMLALDQQQTAPSADRREFFFLATRCAREGRESRRGLLCIFRRPTSASRTKFRRAPRSSAASENGPGGLKRGSLNFFQSLGPILPRARAGWGSLPLADATEQNIGRMQQATQVRSSD